MDKQWLALLIPIMALAIPVVAVVIHGMEKIGRLRIEEAQARAGLGDGASADEIAALRDDVAATRDELEQVQERLDFAERMLVQVREQHELPAVQDTPPGI